MQTFSRIAVAIGLICQVVSGTDCSGAPPKDVADNFIAKGCTRYRIECSPKSPSEFPPIILPPWDICVDSCIRDSENLKLDKTEQECCNECDEQRECCTHCHDPKEYGHRTAFKDRDEEKCKITHDKAMLEHCEQERHIAQGNLEKYLHGGLVAEEEEIE